MADNFLEKHREDYEARKAEWLRKRKGIPKTKRNKEKPDDESL
ncbi:MAG: dehydrogenase [Prevotella sp.]|jgi:hypothetical protein|nr:dehydrogenase [Prevotella sp.]MCI1281727.1 dehydrogenase [Prevotella sp.]